MNREELIANARTRLSTRYPDRDDVEVKHISSFKGMSREELQTIFKNAARAKGIRVQTGVNNNEDKADDENKPNIDL